MNIVISAGTYLPARAVRELFARNHWDYWLGEEDIKWYLAHAHFVATAWDDSQLVGLAVLVGDGRKYLELENLLVDKAYRRQGIARKLMTQVMQAIKRAQPYVVKIEVHEETTEAFYREFGFIRNRSTWLLELESGSESLRVTTRK